VHIAPDCTGGADCAKEHEGLCVETQRCAQGHGESLCDDARGAETTGVFAVSERTDSEVDKIVRDRYKGSE